MTRVPFTGHNSKNKFEWNEISSGHLIPQTEKKKKEGGGELKEKNSVQNKILKFYLSTQKNKQNTLKKK